MSKDTKGRRMTLRKAAIGAAFTLPIVLGACGVGGGEIPTKGLQNPELCLPDFGDK